MGSVCCCFDFSNFEENADSNGSNNGNCICFNCVIQSLKNGYGALFGRGGMHAVPSSEQGAASSNATVALNNSSDSNRASGRTFPNIVPPRYSQLQQDVAVTRHEKGSSHSRVEPEPLIESNVEVIQKFSSGGNKLVGSCCEGGSKECRSESSVKVVCAKVETGVGYAYSSSEDEDVCPTCLEEYTPENPKIIAHCSHHYHLGCIYEWMERSETCPVCGKLMEFDEPT